MLLLSKKYNEVNFALKSNLALWNPNLSSLPNSHSVHTVIQFNSLPSKFNNLTQNTSAGWYFNIIKIMWYGQNIAHLIMISWLSRYIAETQYDRKYCRLWKINHDSLTKNAALYCFKPIQNFTSRCQISVFHGHAQEDRHMPVSNLKIDRTLFIRIPFSNSVIYIDDNWLTFKSNTTHHYKILSIQMLQKFCWE